MDLMTRMSLAANRPLNWNVLQVNSRSGEITANKLSASDYAAERGARVLALTIPDSIRTAHLVPHRLPSRRAQRMGQADGAPA